MKKRLLWIAVSVFIFGCQVANAQGGHVTGRVVDAKSGEAMMYVNVAMMRMSDTVFVRGATTDLEGRFDIRDVDTGSYLVRASFMGYGTYYKPFTCSFRSALVEDLGTISLTPGKVLESVVVTASKPVFVMDGEKNIYNTAEDPSIQVGTASDALQNAPGVEVDAEGNITLRGVSSVEIWINDRPSHMNEEALKQYIKQLPANAIDRIEVVTNPSARYSTNGGVINIVTNQKMTRNELLCIGVRGTTFPSVSPWVSYVWANEKIDLNFYLNGSYTVHGSSSEGTSTLFDSNGDTSRYQEYKTVSRMPYYGGYMGFNLNWNIDSMTHLMTWLGAYPYWDLNSYDKDYQYQEYSPTLLDLGYFDTVRNHGFSYGAYAGAWYEHRFDKQGHKLSASFNGNFWSNSGYSDQWRDYRSSILTDFRRHLDGSTFVPNSSMSVNYTRPLKNDYEMEAGVEVGVGGSYNNEVMDSLLPSGDYSNMAYRSYITKGVAVGLASYVTAQKRWGGFTAKLGLRFEDKLESGMMEHHSLGDRVSLDTAFMGFVPSIHLSYQTKNYANYSLSYTRRFSFSEDLSSYTAFRIYDDYSFQTGNPNLMMSYTHNLEAAWNKYIIKFGNVGLSAYFRANTNEVGSMTAAVVDPAIGPYLVNYTYPVNIGSSHTEGLEANVTYRPSGFFNVRFNASLFNYGYDYNDFVDSKVSWSANVNVWAKVWQRLEIFVKGNYSSPRLGLYSLSNASEKIDFGLSSDFFDRKMSVYLNVNDVFGTAQWGSNSTAPSYQTTGSTRYNSRFVSVGLTWRIGKMELESKARQGDTQSTMGVGKS